MDCNNNEEDSRAYDVESVIAFTNQQEKRWPLECFDGTLMIQKEAIVELKPSTPISVPSEDGKLRRRSTRLMSRESDASSVKIKDKTDVTLIVKRRESKCLKVKPKADVETLVNRADSIEVHEKSTNRRKCPAPKKSNVDLEIVKLYKKSPTIGSSQQLVDLFFNPLPPVKFNPNDLFVQTDEEKLRSWRNRRIIAKRVTEDGSTQYLFG